MSIMFESIGDQVPPVCPCESTTDLKHPLRSSQLWASIKNGNSSQCQPAYAFWSGGKILYPVLVWWSFSPSSTSSRHTESSGQVDTHSHYAMYLTTHFTCQTETPGSVDVDLCENMDPVSFPRRPTTGPRTRILLST